MGRICGRTGLSLALAWLVLAAAVIFTGAAGAAEGPGGSAGAGADPFAGWPGIVPSACLPIDRVRQGLAYWDAPPKVVSAYDKTYFDFRAILWQGPPKDAAEEALFFSRLRELHFTGGMAYGDLDPKPFALAALPYYRTNICNLLYIRNKSLGKKMEELKKNRTKALLNREPSLEDPAVLLSEEGKASATAKMDRPNQPLSYDLRDEASYTSFANPFEFDFSPVALAGFRVWLKTQYADLTALNAQWETKFTTWEEVQPFLVDELRQREWKDKKDMSTVNLAPCVDHRAYTDTVWYKATGLYKAAIDKVDAGAPVGFSGTQMPSAWGGFDFDLYGRTLTWCEYYDICGSREILRGLCQEDTPMVAATGYENRTLDALRLWSNVLHGDKGCLVWPFGGNDLDKGSRLFDQKAADWPLTPVGKNLQANLGEVRCGIAPLLGRAQFQQDGVAILYHQPSIQADWFFETKRDGKSWVNRYSSWESGHNYMAAARVSLHKLLEDTGVQYTYARSEDVVKDRLAANGIRVLVLVRNVCLSDVEIAGLKRFVEGGGVVVSDLMTGRLDNHGTVRSAEKLKEINALLGVTRGAFAWQEIETDEPKEGFGKAMALQVTKDFGGWKAGSTQSVVGFCEAGLKAAADATAYAGSADGDAVIVAKRGKGSIVTLNFDLPNYKAQRNDEKAAAAVASAQAVFRQVLTGLPGAAGVRPVVQVTDAKGAYPGRVETIRYADGATQYVALIGNREVLIDWETLKDTAAGAQAENPTRPVTVQLPAARFAFEVLGRKDYGKTDTLKAELPSFRPVIFALRPYAVEKLLVESSGKLNAQKQLDVKLTLTMAAGSLAGAKLGNHVVHARLLDGAGAEIPEGVVNLPLPGGAYEGAIDFSQVKVKGPYKLTLWDVTSSAEAVVAVAVE